MPEWIERLAMSDYLLLAAFIALLWFLVDYGVFTPWWRWKEHGFIGYAVMLFTLSVFILMGIIIYGTVAGQRVDEPMRIVALSTVLLGIVGKTVILHYERRVGRLQRLSAKGELMNDTANTVLSPPDIWYKAQRVVRTVFAFLVVAVPLLNAVAAATVNYLEDQTDVVIPSWVFLFLNGVIAVTALLIGLFNAWMQTPGFNTMLTRIGLGSVPKSQLVPVAPAGGGKAVAAVIPDPKADPAPALPPAFRVGE
jgi:hypothetical protein